MDYLVEFEGNSYELKNYTLQISENLESIKSITNLKEKVRKIYKFLEEVIEADVKELLGELKDIDPNRIQILFGAVDSAYNKPLMDSQADQLADMIDKYNLADIDKFLNTAGQVASKIKK